jgi:hypothetical protein
MGVFLEPKHGTEHNPGGIVNGGMEHEARAPVFEPGMVAAVHLDKQAGLGHPFAAAAMAGRPPGAGAADPGLAEQPLDGGPREPNLFAFGEQLGEVGVIAAGIQTAGEFQHAGPDLLGGAARGGPSLVPMGEGSRAALSHPGQ